MTETYAPAPDGLPHDAPAVGTERVWPAVSVIMPVLNEERHLAASVTQILAQQYCGEVELVLALGPSKDDTDRIARELAATDPRVKLVRNPSGRRQRAGGKGQWTEWPRRAGGTRPSKTSRVVQRVRARPAHRDVPSP